MTVSEATSCAMTTDIGSVSFDSANPHPTNTNITYETYLYQVQ